MTFQVRDSLGHGPQAEEGAFFLREFFCRVSTLTKATRNGPAPQSPPGRSSQETPTGRHQPTAQQLRGSGAEHRGRPDPFRSLHPPLWLSSQERTFLWPASFSLQS